MEKKVTGKEVRYTLSQNNINLAWLSQQLGITPQTLQSRLNAQEFKRAYMIEITNILGRDIFGLDNEQGNPLMKQPVLDIRVCAGNGVGLEGDENKVAEYVSYLCPARTIYHSIQPVSLLYSMALNWAYPWRCWNTVSGNR